eukprot:4842337-Alexandrium_andersonii.AAC.1
MARRTQSEPRRCTECVECGHSEPGRLRCIVERPHKCYACQVRTQVGQGKCDASSRHTQAQ